MSQPPPIPGSRTNTERILWALFLAMLVALVIAPLSNHGWLPIPPCFMRTATGIPCPFCGGTRCVAALGHAQWRQAFLFNPLVAAGCVTLLVWALLRLLEMATRGTWLTSFSEKIRIRFGWPAVFVAVFVNWILLMYMRVV